MIERCPCVIKWMEDTKKKLNAVDVFTDISYNSEHLSYRKIVNPKDNYYEQDNKPRISKYKFCADSKEFKFCPHCGKEFKAIPKPSEEKDV